MKALRLISESLYKMAKTYYDEIRFYDAAKVIELCNSFEGWENEKMRKELIKIAQGRADGTVDIVGENGAHRDDAISALTMAIGGPY